MQRIRDKERSRKVKLTDERYQEIEDVWKPVMRNCSIHLFGSDELWKRARRQYLCASETASVLGIGFRSALSIWKEKVLGECDFEPSPALEDLMARGSKAEAHIRELFAIDHGFDKVYDGTHALIVNNMIMSDSGNPFMACTLDAWAHDATGEPLIIEIKRSESPKMFGETPPPKYYAQVLKQMIVTGIRRAWLVAHVSYFMPDGRHKAYFAEYLISADDESVENDMRGIVEKERRFWSDCVEKKKRPATVIPWM